MKNITLTTSMVFDAICTLTCLQQYDLIVGMALPEQKQALDVLRERTDDDFKNVSGSFSSVCEMVRCNLNDPTTATLCELCEALEKTENLAGKDEYIRCIKLLEDIGFEEVWKGIILPAEEEYIQKIEDDYKDKDISSVFELISKLKSKRVDGTTVYFAVMSYPVSFSFSNNTFVQAVPRDREDVDRLLPLIAHELMHHFSSECVYDLYRKHINSNLYLRSTHNALINDKCSGDEEEHVMAAEYYILVKSGIRTYRDIVMRNCRRYGNCVPNAMYIFGKMAECDDIGDLNEWLSNAYENGVIKADEVIEYVDEMLPTPKTDEEFYKIALSKISPCWYIAKGAFKEGKDDIKNDIEALLGAEFVLQSGKSVTFCRDEKALPESVRMETLTADGITVDRLQFDSIEDALGFEFKPMGLHTEVPIEYNGERFENAHQYSIIDRNCISVQMSFTCQSLRYVIKVYPLDAKSDIAQQAERYECVFDCIKRVLDIMVVLNV